MFPEEPMAAAGSRRILFYAVALSPTGYSPASLAAQAGLGLRALGSGLWICLTCPTGYWLLETGVLGTPLGPRLAAWTLAVWRECRVASGGLRACHAVGCATVGSQYVRVQAPYKAYIVQARLLSGGRRQQ